MDYRERWEDQTEALLAALDGHSARTWCSGPGIVESVNLEQQTCNIQPAIMGRVEQFPAPGTPAGTPPVYKWVPLPLLVDCPIIFLRGGGFAVTVPLKKGDEVTVFFADRCIDGWWSSGQVSPQSEIRFHDLSDGFVLPGPASKPKAIPNISADSLQVRSDDGTQYFELAAGGVSNIMAPGGLNITANGANVVVNAANVSVTATEQISLTAPVILLAGGIVIDGTVTGEGVGGGTIEIDAAVNATGEGTFNGHTVGNHTHTQGNDGAGDSEVPTNTPTG